MTTLPVRFGAFHPIAKIHTGQRTDSNRDIQTSAEELAKALNSEHPYERGWQELCESSNSLGTRKYGPKGEEIRALFREKDEDYKRNPFATVVRHNGTIGIATGRTALTLLHMKKAADPGESAASSYPDFGFMARLGDFLDAEKTKLLAHDTAEAIEITRPIHSWTLAVEHLDGVTFVKNEN